MKTNNNSFDDFEDDFEDQDLSKLTVGDKKIVAAINKVIADNTDNRTKTVGDRILVWDTSRLTNAETGERVEDDNEELVLTVYPSIVIEDRIRIEAKLTTLAGEFTKILDLKVWNKKLNKVYLTSSDFVKIV
jgi:hypothetical protein